MQPKKGILRGDRPGMQIGLAICLGLALLALSYVRISGDAGSAAFGNKIVDAALAQPVWGTALGNRLTAFAATQIALHAVFGLLCLALARLSRFAWPRSQHSPLTWLLLWFTCGASWLLVANATLFPDSSLGQPYAEWVAASWHGVSLYSIYSTLLACGLAGTLCSAMLRIVRSAQGRSPSWFLAAGAAGALLVVIAIRMPLAESTASGDKPHIILIGLDSLRADAVGRKPVTMTPAIDEFLRGSVNFTDATTPLARTFPSWVSIITGRHPHTTGAVINLLPRELIQTGETLPQLLSRVGYRSVYAIDEVRFSNLDRSYGFDEMIAPPMGATDFMLGFFSDAPLSNLIVNTRLGALLFPYSHANRAMAVTYDPDSFVERLDRELEFDQPTFLAAHFTLAHWPYTWATARESQAQAAGLPGLYERAVARLDRQFADFMQVLRKRGALDNALVVLLSDHGESLGSYNLRYDGGAPPLPPGIPEYDETILQGHGTSVFSSHQYRVVLAIRSYGNALAAAEPRTIEAPVSLEDVTPTIVAAAGAPFSQPFDGRSLLPLLTQSADAAAFADRIRFAETEFNPPGFMAGQIPRGSSLVQAAAYYRIDPVTDRALIRSERLDELLVRRQYAAFRNGKLLALIPPTPGTPQTDPRFLLALEGQAPVLVQNPAEDSDRDVVELAAALATRFPQQVQRP